ncbi:MAG: D-alanyl-D-alanine carboxypeptidase family protein [Bacillota bacterium]
MRRSTMRGWAALAAAVLLLSTAAPAFAADHRWAPALGLEDGDQLARPAVATPDAPVDEVKPGGKENSLETASPKAVPTADPVKITSPSAVLMEARSGRVLYQKNAHERRNPASVTKIMTLIVAFDALRDGKVKLDDKVTISEEAAEQIGTIIFADTGETFSFQELLLSVAVGSANDAAVAVAEHVAGSVEAFVQRMNAKARELGMNDTQFMNPTGLSAEGHMTSAYDIALMSRYAALNYPELIKLTAIYGADLQVPWRKNGPIFRLWNNNKLLTWYQGADGLKTGWTELAGYCLAATAVRNDVRMISVIMGAESPKVRNAEAARLLDYGFANYTSVEVAPANKRFGPIQVARGKLSKVELVPRTAFGVSVAKGEQDKVKVEVKLPRRVTAPLTQFQPVGEIIATLDGKPIGRMELVTPVAIEEANLWEMILQHMKGVFTLR